ncbi:hypothetical protein MC885_020429 [Smutsia gigantea]|nr:hypothetical protein MC885_020429 [Smutsia gigantea]
MEKALGSASSLTHLCSVLQRLADAAENFQKAHRWQDNIKAQAMTHTLAVQTQPWPRPLDTRETVVPVDGQQVRWCL